MTFPNDASGIAGILLAAGRGTRFDPAGEKDKLLATLPDGIPVAVSSARHLRAALKRVVAVVRPGSGALEAALRNAGCEVLVCPDAALGMAASLTHGVRHAAEASGWVVALADMPFVRPETIALLARRIADGAGIAAPVCGGRRGNPVGFGRIHLARLLALEGDQGARALLQAWPVDEVTVGDDGIFRDIDVPHDLPRAT